MKVRAVVVVAATAVLAAGIAVVTLRGGHEAEPRPPVAAGSSFEVLGTGVAAQMDHPQALDVFLP